VTIFIGPTPWGQGPRGFVTTFLSPVALFAAPERRTLYIQGERKLLVRKKNINGIKRTKRRMSRFARGMASVSEAGIRLVPARRRFAPVFTVSSHLLCDFGGFALPFF
jgi:hypothetical protein